jgi:hypothetical protein
MKWICRVLSWFTICIPSHGCQQQQLLTCLILEFANAFAVPAILSPLDGNLDGYGLTHGRLCLQLPHLGRCCVRSAHKLCTSYFHSTTLLCKAPGDAVRTHRNKMSFKRAIKVVMLRCRQGTGPSQLTRFQQKLCSEARQENDPPKYTAHSLEMQFCSF